jgi:hypothetical protein
MAEKIIKRKIIKRKKKKKQPTQAQKQKQSVVIKNIINIHKPRGGNKPLSIAKQKEKDSKSALVLGGQSMRAPLNNPNTSGMLDLADQVRASVRQQEIMNMRFRESERRSEQQRALVREKQARDLEIENLERAEEERKENIVNSGQLENRRADGGLDEDPLAHGGGGGRRGRKPSDYKSKSEMMRDLRDSGIRVSAGTTKEDLRMKMKDNNLSLFRDNKKED